MGLAAEWAVGGSMLGLSRFKGIGISESGKFLLIESGIQGKFCL